MPLLKPGVYLHDIFGEAVANQIIDNGEEDLYEHDNIKEDTGYDTDGCINDDDPHEPTGETPIETENGVEYRNDKQEKP